MIDATSFRLNKIYLIKLLSGQSFICKVLFISDKTLIVETQRYSEFQICYEDISRIKPQGAITCNKI